jgi:hypothetical protein
MNLKLFTAVAIFATAHIVAFAQNEPLRPSAEANFGFQIRCRMLKTETILKQSMHLSIRPILSHSKWVPNT